MTLPSATLLDIVQQTPEPWPGPLTYIGLALLLVAALMTIYNRRRK
ncbi:MAG: hypothetical protein KatS3mg055_3291 [Chloroflexus sp.]|nr:hypothetical protein [Chloroflexus sp.]GIV90773.1 MAG: hypothetical protein KatS3mg055_3291 [Chloroflexus sp.]